MEKVLNSPEMMALQEEDRKTLEKHMRGVQ
jgi:hypothetical protein